MNKFSSQRGAVSIFIVVFTALLITVITASFIQIMVRSQEQASSNDLAQSAYDSALAGVEDAKRALIKLRECEQVDEEGVCAATLRNAMDDGSCTEALRVAGISFADGTEQQVGEELNQAYTCVKIQLNTENVDGVMTTTQPDVVHLDTGNKPYTKIRLSWFRADDLPEGASQEPSFSSNFPDLPANQDSEWPRTQPPLVRAQLIQFKKGELDVNIFNKENTKNALTTFLYPDSDVTYDNEISMAGADFRRQGPSRNSPRQAGCESDFSAGNVYLCSVILNIPVPEDATVDNRDAYLQLSSYYGSTHYMIQPLDDSGNVVEFRGVQPRVDSTGRASDLFRRVQARVNITDAGSKLPFPETALYVRDNLCKDFFVTNKKEHYDSNVSNDIECEAAAD